MQVSIRASIERGTPAGVHPLTPAFERAARLGFDSVELCMEAGAWSFRLAGAWDQAEIETVQALAQRLGLAIYSLSSDWAWSYASFFPKLSNWARGVELIGDDARLAASLGAHTMLVHLATSKGTWDDCKAVLKEIAAIGEETRVGLGYEANIWERLGFGGLDSLCRMVDEIGSPYLGVYLHNNYPRAGLPLQDEIAQAGPRLVKCMHSSSLVAGRVEIDWPKALAAIKQRWADGVYTFEVDWDVAEANKRALDEVLARYA